MRPQTVTIIQKPDFVRVGEEYELVCQAYGSKPAAEVTWYRGHTAIEKAKVTVG